MEIEIKKGGKVGLSVKKHTFRLGQVRKAIKKDRVIDPILTKRKKYLFIHLLALPYLNFVPSI